MKRIDVPGSKLVLGDKVRLIEDDPDGWATVVKLSVEEVTLFRAYVHLGDFSYTGGVLHYVGTETFTVIRPGRSYTVDAATHKRMSRKGALA